MLSIFNTHFQIARPNNSDISCQMAAALKKRRGKGGLWRMKISKQRVAGVRSDQIISRPNTSELVTCGPRQRHQARIMLLAPPQLGELRPGGCRRLRTRTAFRTRTSLHCSSISLTLTDTVEDTSLQGQEHVPDGDAISSWLTFSHPSTAIMATSRFEFLRGHDKTVSILC
jgi:hypothetical protein